MAIRASKATTKTPGCQGTDWKSQTSGCHSGRLACCTVSLWVYPPWKRIDSRSRSTGAGQRKGLAMAKTANASNPHSSTEPASAPAPRGALLGEGFPQPMDDHHNADNGVEILARGGHAQGHGERISHPFQRRFMRHTQEVTVLVRAGRASSITWLVYLMVKVCTPKKRPAGGTKASASTSSMPATATVRATAGGSGSELAGPAVVGRSGTHHRGQRQQGQPVG